MRLSSKHSEVPYLSHQSGGWVVSNDVVYLLYHRCFQRPVRIPKYLLDCFGVCGTSKVFVGCEIGSKVSTSISHLVYFRTHNFNPYMVLMHFISWTAGCRIYCLGAKQNTQTTPKRVLLLR